MKAVVEARGVCGGSRREPVPTCVGTVSSLGNPTRIVDR
jgi:hypothetical protein